MVNRQFSTSQLQGLFWKFVLMDKFPWALRPGVWGPPWPPFGSRGNAPVGGPGGRSPPAENDFRHFYAPRNTSPGINFHFFNCLSEV